MAHIRNRGKRRDGSTIWQARMPDPARPGGTRQIERTFRTKQEAQDWLTQQQSSILHGTYVNPATAKRPFGDVLTAWQESWHNLSPTTADRYAGILRLYLQPAFGTQPIGSVTFERVQRFINALAQEHAAGTVRNIYACLRNACSTGFRMQLLRINPCTGVVLPKSPREEMLFLSAEEVAALADAIDPFYRTAVYVAAYTGLRAGEQWALQRQDVDLANSRVHVRRARQEVGGVITIGPTKTAGSRRTISLPMFLTEMLREHMRSVPLNPDALVFTSKRGQPVRHGLLVRRRFKPAVTKALPPHLHGLRWHDLRHTAASLAVAAGAHPKLISARLGHASVAITLDRYSHLFPSAEEALAAQLDAAYAAGTGQCNAPAGALVPLR
jgi:integrase